VRIDGGPERESPLGLVALPAGEHRLKAYREGFRTIERPFRIRPGETYEMKLFLSPAEYGTVKIVLQGAPWAYCRIDGGPELELPQGPIRLAEGRHSVIVYRDGYRQLVRSFGVAPDQETALEISLEESR
jgi:hypothetical protein